MVSRTNHEAYFFETSEQGVKCLLCPRECVLEDGDVGFCGIRKAKGKILYTLSYGNPCAVNIDPIEKKPFNHFLPGTKAYSIATAGCNLRCLNCQNWTISQSTPNETSNYKMMPNDVVSNAITSGCKSIAYTYTEPITFYEYVFDCATIAKERGIRNVIKSSGYINPKPLKKWCEVIDAANIDLKSFDDKTYRKMSKASLQPILDTLITLKENGVWLEITHLLVPSWSDDYKELEKMCKWLSANGFSDTPIHFSRFFPLYKLEDLPPTPIETLEQAYEIAVSEGLKYVYTANTLETDHSDTCCPKCGERLIQRHGYSVDIKNITNGICGKCGEKIAGIFS